MSTTRLVSSLDRESEWSRDDTSATCSVGFSVDSRSLQWSWADALRRLNIESIQVRFDYRYQPAGRVLTELRRDLAGLGRMADVGICVQAEPNADNFGPLGTSDATCEWSYHSDLFWSCGRIWDVFRGIASSLSIDLGMVPSHVDLPLYTMLVSRVRRLADLLVDRGHRLRLVAGGTNAAHLSRFAETVACENVDIEFDAGRFVVYGTEEPLRALPALLERTGSIRLTDAVWSEKPAELCGREVSLGGGQVEAREIVRVATQNGFKGIVFAYQCENEDDDQTIASWEALVEGVRGYLPPTSAMFSNSTNVPAVSCVL